jgi:hypothetical protein
MILLRRVLVAVCLTLIVLFAIRQVHDAIATPAKGLDFGPMRDAALALVHGRAIYSNPRFVYPPTAAIALLPLTIGAEAGAVNAWLILCTIAVAVAGLLSMAPCRRGIWVLAAVLAAALLVRSDTLTDSLWIGNVSLLLAPAAVGVLLLFESERWRAGSALLVVSLLIKPVLIPLVLLPLLRGQWRTILEAAICGCVALALAIVFVPGGGHFFAVLRFLENGGTLKGQAAVYNVSIRGLAERLGDGTWGTAARVIVVALTAMLAYRFARRPLRSGDVASLGALLLLALLLAGSLTEDHYLLVVAPCLLLALALRSEPGALVLALPGLALFAFPARYIGSPATSPAGLQVRFVLAELALGAAAALFVARPAGPSPPSALPHPIAG